MAMVKVYRYDYYDNVLKCDRRSVDYATADAIMAMGGTILVETEQSVHEELLDEQDAVRAAHVFMEPPRKPVRAAHRPRA